MIYSWGYIKENVLSKLNIDEEEALNLGFLSRFPYAANEAMTQICSAIKPKEAFFTFTTFSMQTVWEMLTEKYGVYIGSEIIEEELDEDKEAFWQEWKTYKFVDMPITFPEDFVAFSDDVAEFNGVEVHDEVLTYHGYNQVICKASGMYRIPYKARWFFFTKDLQNNVNIPAPADIIEAIPSYIASQCLKIDDEAKSAIYRNEYEMFLARIDDTSFKRQRTFTIGGNW